VDQDKRIAEVLAEFLVSQKYERLPKEPIEKAKEYALDVIGCIVGASQEQQARTLIEVMKTKRKSAQLCLCVWFQNLSHECCNGKWYHGHTFDFDDDHREGTMHPSVAVFPAVFALERSGAFMARISPCLYLGLES